MASVSPKRSRSPLKILFIGNSFTARNDLPGLIAGLAAARGLRLEHRLITAGGASLRTHWNAGEAPRAVESGDYHAVVLQEQSTLPVKNPARMHENVRLFDAAIRAAGARTLLYMTWARLHAPQDQAVIASAYESIGRELHATIVPAGAAWERYLRDRDRPVLHDRDQSHPTLAGSYLAACVFEATLWGPAAHGPDGSHGDGGTPVGLSLVDAYLLRAVAAQTVAERAKATRC